MTMKMIVPALYTALKNPGLCNGGTQPHVVPTSARVKLIVQVRKPFTSAPWYDASSRFQPSSASQKAPCPLFFRLACVRYPLEAGLRRHRKRPFSLQCPCSTWRFARPASLCTSNARQREGTMDPTAFSSVSASKLCNHSDKYASTLLHTNFAVSTT